MVVLTLCFSNFFIRKVIDFFVQPILSIVRCRIVCPLWRLCRIRVVLAHRGCSDASGRTCVLRTVCVATVTMAGPSSLRPQKCPSVVLPYLPYHFGQDFQRRETVDKHVSPMECKCIRSPILQIWLPTDISQ